MRSDKMKWVEIRWDEIFLLLVPQWRQKALKSKTVVPKLYKLHTSSFFTVKDTITKHFQYLLLSFISWAFFHIYTFPHLGPVSLQESRNLEASKSPLDWNDRVLMISYAQLELRKHRQKDERMPQSSLSSAPHTTVEMWEASGESTAER